MATTEIKTFTLPPGRLINHSLFERDQYNEKSSLAYKAEVAYGKGVLNDFFNSLLDIAIAEWGKDVEDDVIIPIKDGDQMAAKREKNDKAGDAYASMDVVRAHTIFNKHGEAAAGGIAVYGPDLEEITVATSSEIYRGCMVEIAVTAKPYKKELNGSLIPALTLYLVAVHKVADGDRIGGDGDQSGLFKPAVATKSREDVSDASGKEETPAPRRRRKS